MGTAQREANRGCGGKERAQGSYGKGTAGTIGHGNSTTYYSIHVRKKQIEPHVKLWGNRDYTAEGITTHGSSKPSAAPVHRHWSNGGSGRHGTAQKCLAPPNFFTGGRVNGLRGGGSNEPDMSPTASEEAWHQGRAACTSVAWIGFCTWLHTHTCAYGVGHKVLGVFKARPRESTSPNRHRGSE